MSTTLHAGFRYTRFNATFLVPLYGTQEYFTRAACSSANAVSMWTREAQSPSYCRAKHMIALKLLKNHKASNNGKILPFAATEEDARVLIQNGTPEFYCPVQFDVEPTGPEVELKARWFAWMDDPANKAAISAEFARVTRLNWTRPGGI